jgi:hypothetical protein
MASDKTTTPVSLSSVTANLVTSFDVHTPATFAFRKQGQFIPATGVTRELPVPWLAVCWGYSLLPLVMRGCGMPIVWAAILPNSPTCETLAFQKGKYLINTVGEPWNHVSPMCQRQSQDTVLCRPTVLVIHTPDWPGSPNASVVLAKNITAILHEQLDSYLLLG